MAGNQQQPDSTSPPQERYTTGYSTAAVERYTRRTADQDAGFIVPHLRSSMSLLDCGCGPGTITVGLAEIVSPGQVVGIDIEASQIEIAKDRATRQGVTNVRFEVGNIYEIPFPDGTFDAVLAHAVLNYLGDPRKALQEMYRVLRSGGVAGVRASDIGGDIFEPNDDPIIGRSREFAARLIQHNGGNAHTGRRLRGLLGAAGFHHVQAWASYDCFGTAELVKYWGERQVGAFTQPPISEQLIELGWANQAELESIAAYWRTWGERPDAFGARCYGHAIGWKG